MTRVFIVADNIVSPLGATTAENFQQLTNGISGIKEHRRANMAVEPFYASLFEEPSSVSPTVEAQYTFFEQLLINSISDALQQCTIDLSSPDTILIISTTKGNISLLENHPLTLELERRLSLTQAATVVGDHFGAVNKPIVVSNACISGLLALLTAMRLLQSGRYQHAVVAGADGISKFVLSGFQSFQAISASYCRPFDKDRNGINLGEGAGTMILSAAPQYATDVSLIGGAVSNDANHISGPSRTGAELYQAIRRALEQGGIATQKVDFISAHGTATIYNDEMEALAVSLAGLQATPINSVKGHYGHTLGAAGIIESIIAVQSMRQNLLLPSKGYAVSGVSVPLKITTALEKGDYHYCLKTASGFGGCNAALLFNKA